MSERTDAKFFGMEYVIAGRMVRQLTDIRIRECLAESGSSCLPLPNTELSMKLWSIRQHIVNRYRHIEVVDKSLSTRRVH